MKKAKRSLISILFLLMTLTLTGGMTAQAAKVKLSATKITVAVGKTKKLKVKNTYKKITWKSSNKAVAAVSNKGIVTAKKAGKAIVSAKVKGGKKYKCIVTVKENKKTYNTQVYKDQYVTITVAYITPQNIFYTVKNNSNQVIQVDCDHFQLDGKTYTYQDTNYSVSTIMLAPAETRTYEFCDWDCGNKISFSISEIECKKITGIFNIWDSVGNLLKVASFSNVSLK